MLACAGAGATRASSAIGVVCATHKPSRSCRVAPTAKRCVPRQRTSRMPACALSTSISSASVPTSCSCTTSLAPLRASLPARSATTPNGACSRRQRDIRSR